MFIPWAAQQEAYLQPVVAPIVSAPEPRTGTTPADYRVEPVSQQGLLLNGQPTYNGCVPTGASMITDYWHGRSPDWNTRTAQEYLDANAQWFGPNGLSASYLIDDLEQMGYTATPRINASLDELQADAGRGPVLAYVRLGMKPQGAAHVVVVTDVDRENVTVVDPWDATERKYPMGQFSASWDTDFGDGRSRNYLAIVPVQEPEKEPVESPPPPWRKPREWERRIGRAR